MDHNDVLNRQALYQKTKEVFYFQIHTYTNNVTLMFEYSIFNFTVFRLYYNVISIIL